MIAITTHAAVTQLTSHLAEILAGGSVQLYDAAAGGGMKMEAHIRQGLVRAVLDLAPCDLASNPHPDRLTAAGLSGVPQIIASGGLHDGVASESLDALGKEIAEKACAARGPTLILLPADAPAVLRQSLRNWIYPPELLEESPHTIHDRRFAEQIAERLREMLSNLQERGPARG